ncbi:BamA/TamA family outer membrane protein [Cecembia lonarensis]|uniref:Outer membrane protein/protective antigen OMA87 n=1 Tax=Cecembia lonarensis (strain CCUG 58316 / KCTC 22772 / LW9) TaxID=1225176 RepID=K1KZ90_CECL9|nr:BamA/TamA family outer membrane protein [Cecembia lonarensis]EKB49500.1 Outer membrane protein/protective antigen OMA87 [Cecembia lonarensis LW9]
MKKSFLFLFISVFLLAKTQAQIFQDSIKQEKTGIWDKAFDLGDQIIDLISGENWAFIPIIVYSPETSLGLGIRAIRVFQFKDQENALLRPSSLPITFLYTLNRQAIFTSEINLWSNANKNFFNARLELSDFPFRFYGIGQEPVVEEGEFYSTRYAYLHLLYQKRLTKGLYLGGRYEFRVDNIYEKKEGGLLDAGNILGSDGQRLSGMGIVLSHDTRDQIFQPTKGWFSTITLMGFPDWLGSNFTFSQYTIDVRKYTLIGSQKVLTIQSWWNLTSGNAPFQHISLMGGSERMRGFFEGRYRDRHAMIQQAELRTPIYRNLGMVFFGHSGLVFPNFDNIKLSKMRYGAGLGFRYRLNKEGLNVRLDFAYGDQKAFYFGLNEAF